MTRRTIGTTALLVALALAGWLVSRDLKTPIDNPDVEAPPPPPEDDTLHGAPIGLPPGTQPPPVDPPVKDLLPAKPPRAGPGTIHLTGQVLDADARRVGNGLVWLVDPGDEHRARRVIGSARVLADGTYALDASLVLALSSSTLRLCAAIDGIEAVWLDAPVTVGGSAVVDVRLPADSYLVLTGRVFDAERAPVAGLPLRLTNGWTSAQYVPLAVVSPEADVANQPSETRFVRTITDTQGRFSVRVRSPQGLGFVSESADWFVRTRMPDVFNRGLDASAHDVDVRADPAVTLTASIRDAKSGAPVARFEGHANDAASSHFIAFDGAQGLLAMRWPRWWKADERMTMQLDVEAKEYAPARVFVVFEAGIREANTDVVMTPATPDARADVTFDIRDSNGQPFDGRWVVRIVDPRDAAKTAMELTLTRIGAGQYRAPIPAGRWPLLVKTGGGLGFIRRTFDAEIVAGVPVTLRCDMPAHGSLKLSWSPRAAEGGRTSSSEGLLEVTPAQGGTGSGIPLPPGKHEFLAPALPEGDWTIRLYRDGLRGTSEDRTARIVAGTETTIDFEKP